LLHTCATACTLGAFMSRRAPSVQAVAQVWSKVEQALAKWWPE
jgi:hypothetical protein